MVQTKLQTVTYETFLLDVMAPEVHWNDRCMHVMYVSSEDLLSVYYANILDGGWLHGGPQKNYKLSIWGMGTCPGQYGINNTKLEGLGEARGLVHFSMAAIVLMVHFTISGLGPAILHAA